MYLNNMLAIILIFVLMGIRLFVSLIFHREQREVNFYYTLVRVIIEIMLLHSAGLFDKIDW